MDTKEIIKLVIEGLMLLVTIGGAVFKVISAVRSEFEKLHVLIAAQNVEQVKQAASMDHLKEQLSDHRREFASHVDDDKSQFEEIRRKFEWFTSRIEGIILGKKVAAEERGNSRELIG
jgi:hypothetical protein